MWHTATTEHIFNTVDIESNIPAIIVSLFIMIPFITTGYAKDWHKKDGYNYLKAVWRAAIRRSVANWWL